MAQLTNSLFIIFLIGLCVSCVLAAQEKVTHHVTFDMTIGDEHVGSIKLGLFGAKNPKTVENFLAFADKGVNSNKYEGSTFHRIIKDFMIQGGDVLNGDGTGSISKFGPTFEDEPTHKHGTVGLLSMANRGPNTNGSQFFITTILTPWLDGKHVVFGKVVDDESMKTVTKIEKTEVDEHGRPYKKVKIVKSTVEELSPADRYPVDIGPQ